MDESGVRFVATYQPLWEGQTDDFARYREELEDMLITQNLLVIGGDFNSSVGDTRERSRDTVAGKFGLGKTNTAGVDLIEWCHANQLAWVNSFFQHKNRGTWKNPANGSWHEARARRLSG